MKKLQGTRKLLLKKTAITPLDSALVKGGVNTLIGCAQPTSTVQHTYICPSIRMVCLTTQTLRCTTE
ncbi:hypothetical protein [Taibaiella koreensis]|uniref:hypothetical protein n=1 Tax=Taibaiella koreensis TaxID=1268548 RepID=UPI000E5997AE|nr:hypothetical protein [Taibaiella koreensis]